MGRKEEQRREMVAVLVFSAVTMFLIRLLMDLIEELT